MHSAYSTVSSGFEKSIFKYWMFFAVISTPYKYIKRNFFNLLNFTLHFPTNDILLHRCKNYIILMVETITNQSLSLTQNFNLHLIDPSWTEFFQEQIKQKYFNDLFELIDSSISDDAIETALYWHDQFDELFCGWILKNMIYRDEIVIYRVISADPAGSRHFLVNLKERLRREFKQEEVPSYPKLVAKKPCCVKCKETDEKQFSQRLNGNGYQSYCKQCMKDYRDIHRS